MQIGCNRESPCAHCVRAKIECTYTDARRPKEKRARILLSHQYEQKIDHLDSRLDEIVGLLKDLKVQGAALPPAIQVQSPPRTSQATPSAPSPVSSYVAHHAGRPEAKSPMVEGDSSLTAHSVFANDFLRNAINKDSRPEMREGLDALHVIIEAMRHQPAAHEMTYPHAGPARPPPFESCELPPIDRTLQVLKLAQSKEMQALAWIYEFLPISQFQDSCFRLYISEQHSLISIITVNVGLHFLFWACAQIVTETKEEYEKYARQCGATVETALANLPLHLPATDDAITALLLGVRANLRYQIVLCFIR